MFPFVRSTITEEKERRFRVRYAERSIPIIRVSLPLAAALYLLFLGWDYYIESTSLVYTLAVRLPFSVFAILVVGLTFLKSFERWSQPVLCFTVVLGAAGIIVILGILPNGFSFGIPGILLVIMYACGASRLLTGAAIIACIAIIALTNAMLYFTEASSFQIINTNCFVISASLIGLACTWLLESMERLTFGLDELTGLPNRALLNDRIKYALSMSQRNKQKLALLFLDLDHFKNVNDSLGHSIGDQLLIQLAKRLQTVTREEDTVSRLGGDEFILVLLDTDAVGAAHVAEKLLAAVAQPYQIKQHELVTTPSIGIAIYPDDGQDFETLSRCADVAMYRAKKSGRNAFRFFTPEMQAHSARNLQLGNALRHALELNQMQLHYQPQVSLQDGRVIGAEALLRWQHPEFGAVSPSEFIPIAEDSGLIFPIGEWVLRTATLQLKQWVNNGMTPITMAVNLSAIQFRNSQLPDLIAKILNEADLSPKNLELELTEGVAMENPEAAIAMMNKLNELGVRMSIDDFGTGYSSLSYLKRFQIYKLKIDQSFVRDITIDPEDKAIVSAIISMANSLNMHVIAEGVETAGQLSFLRLQGCGEVQGYYFSKPITAEQFEEFLKTFSCDNHLHCI